MEYMQKTLPFGSVFSSGMEEGSIEFGLYLCYDILNYYDREGFDMKRRGMACILLGLLMILAAGCLVFYNYWEDTQVSAQTQQATALVQAEIEQYVQTKQEENNADVDVFGHGSAVAEPPLYVLTPEMEMPTQKIYNRDYIGVLDIPSKGLSFSVISQWSYSGFQVAPCRYKGSAYTGDLIIAAHNYPSHFGSIKDLTAGDLAIFTDMDGNAFIYEMVEREIIPGTAVEAMEQGDWDMTLFTCTLGGQSRVTVRFEQTNEWKPY